MKNFLLTSFLLFVVTACSTDSEAIGGKNLISNENDLEARETFPLSSYNPYDPKGKEYYVILQEFAQKNSYPNSVAEISMQLSFIAISLKQNGTRKAANLGYSEEEILEILNNPQAKLIEIVQSSLINPSAKIMVIEFVQNLIARQDLQYVNIRDYIIDFDASIVANGNLNEDEKETILTVSTISSYALFAEAERKDRDWEKSVSTKPARAFFKNNEASIISVIALLEKLLY